MSFLEHYSDLVVARVTGGSDWVIRDLVSDERPVSLYLACPPSDLSRTKPLMRLVLNQIARRLTEELPGQERRKLLLMPDEVTERRCRGTKRIGLRAAIPKRAVCEVSIASNEPHERTCPVRTRAIH